MKTADLIPFILLELNQGDKYGFELTKEIETKSNGKIIIKQPTLYTLLKKLEKSKFISSYWQDSEIGGKRHYYKLTENGRLQVSTLPSYDFLMKNALNEDGEEIGETSTNVNTENFVVANENPIVEPSQTEKRHSIMDELLNTDNTPEPIETILPSEEVFSENNIDNLTEMDLNTNNAEILQDIKTSNEQSFANNEGVSVFTQKTLTEPTAISSTEQKANKKDILDIEFHAPIKNDEIKYVDYVNFKNSDNYKYSKKLTQNLLYKTLATCGYLMLILILCSVITNFSGRSTLYYIFFIATIITMVFYPSLILKNMQKIRLKYQKTPYKNNRQKYLYIGIATVLVVLVITIIVNIAIKNNTIAEILSFKNFENFYAPLLMSASVLVDLLFNYIFTSKLEK